MIAKELKELLQTVPDETEIVTYDGGYFSAMAAVIKTIRYPNSLQFKRTIYGKPTVVIVWDQNFFRSEI